MSADNWTICPRCARAAKKKHEEKVLEVAEMYGKVSPEEYMKAHSELPSKPKYINSLREDYQVQICGDVFSVFYKASCDDCGFSFCYEHESEVEL